MRGLLTLKELKTEKIMELIKYAIELKNGHKVTYPNKKVVTLFYENSTRTHYSFQCALMNLGIKVLQCDTNQSSSKKGESLYDTVRTFEYLGVDGVVIRSSKDEYGARAGSLQESAVLCSWPGSNRYRARLRPYSKRDRRNERGNLRRIATLLCYAGGAPRFAGCRRGPRRLYCI